MLINENALNRRNAFPKEVQHPIQYVAKVALALDNLIHEDGIICSWDLRWSAASRLFWFSLAGINRPHQKVRPPESEQSSASCWPFLLVGLPAQNCPTEGPKSGQEVAKDVLPVCVSGVGPEGFEPPTKRL
jgi:hypothetical protein